MAITASVQPESGRIVYMPDPTSRISFSSVVFKDGMDHVAQNRPGSNLGGLVRVWPNASGLEASRCAGAIWPGFWQDATGPLPVSLFQTRFRSSTDVLDCVKPAQIRLGSGDYVRFWPRLIRSGSKPMCDNHPARFRPLLPSRSGPAAHRIRHVYR